MAIDSTLSLLDQPMVFVDVETDGMNYVRGHVIEVAAIRVENGRITEEFRSLINPGIDIPYFITNLTGITTHDVQGAPTFHEVADELYEVMEGALFVAHNVRFDYSFLKQEFRRVGIDFAPKQLCTVRLSRALYPEQRSHKLAALIERHGFVFSDRHRAYDDAHVLWQFLQHARDNFDEATLLEAFQKQLRHPSLPKHINREVIDALPEAHGVYFFDDEFGSPVYIGKSVNIKRRVMSHFTRDSEEYKEFKMAQSVHGIRFQATGGELEALLLESHLIKTLQPLYNRKLRRVTKLTVAVSSVDERGYVTVGLETLADPDDAQRGDILATYPRRGMAKESLLRTVKTYDLCPKLCGLEKSKGACFSYQLGKCRGACVGAESAEDYNRRVALAFEHKKIEVWPYDSPVIVQEQSYDGEVYKGFVVDEWRIVGYIEQDEFGQTTFSAQSQPFDLDSYKILRAFMNDHAKRLTISSISRQHLDDLS